jgi:hypothetical protein
VRQATAAVISKEYWEGHEHLPVIAIDTLSVIAFVKQCSSMVAQGDRLWYSSDSGVDKIRPAS